MRELIKAVKITAILWVLTAIIYPGLMLLVGVILPAQSTGSLIQKDGKIIGSALIGQAFTSDKYFWSRPSSINYGTGNDIKTSISGGSNLSPNNKKALIDERITPEIAKFKNANVKPTADLIYASASGLDPHISVESANNQVQRIAKIRFIPVNQVQNLIPKYTESKFLGIFGEDGVNVLKLNLALDDMK